MNCKKCQIAAPDNVIAFRSSEWLCETCELKAIKITKELQTIYNSGKAGRYLYVSELTNNLDKVAQFFIEEIKMNNPMCAIVLSVPEGIPRLHGAFDGIYIDKDAVAPEIASRLQLKRAGYLKWIDPTTQETL